MKFEDEIARRRTFAIISHPDAGKTTLTEKLLLFGGAIQVAGAVKSNKIKKAATSDFMEIEKQRGISVATSVMGFDYLGKKINILDTPGHKDFAEDTYRTLTAVDSVIVVIDVAKGVEEQTEKLVSVCRMRDIPIIVFINKMDREGKDAFELLDEVEQKLGIKVRPLSWPIGMGKSLKGVYNLYEQKLFFFDNEDKQRLKEGVEITDLEDPQVNKLLGQKYADELREEVELVNGVYNKFSREDYLDAKISPVFFGSALNNFGVKELLECFIEIAPCPKSKESETRTILAKENTFTGFVFKIHANMDPNHRSRIAFVKICSGIFHRNTNYLHVRQGKSYKFASPTAFMAEKKSIVDEAYPGDIIGLPDTGNFKIGDSLSEGEEIKFKGIPTFSPEMLKYVENADAMKSKQLAKGLDQLIDEGVAQLFTSTASGRKVIGTVGALQFEVIQYRLQHEYGASCTYQPVTMHKAVWITSTDKAEMKEFKLRKKNFMFIDKHGVDVYMAENEYSLQQSMERFPKIKFHLKSDF